MGEGSTPPRWRDVNGILLLDKSRGLTSNAALQTVRRLFGARKAGHGGSLDPLASGLLPVMFGEATKFSRFLLEAPKSYEVSARLGEVTDTGDADGTVICRKDPTDIDHDAVNSVLPGFTGEIEQVPPMYSALKHQGRPLYEFARKGLDIQRKPRRVTIYSLERLTAGLPEIRLRVACSKGTYIRSLVSDIGEKLGCGAHVTALRRIRAGGFSIEDAATTDSLASRVDGLEKQEKWALLDSLLLPVDAAASALPQIVLSQASARSILQGQAVRISEFAGEAPGTGMVRLKTDAGIFLGVGQSLGDGVIKPSRLVNITEGLL